MMRVDTSALCSNKLKKFISRSKGVSRQELEYLRRHLSKLPTDGEHIGLIHYDFETDTIFYEAEKSRYCVNDFDDAMVHWYAMDTASAISDLLDEEEDDSQRKIEHFLIGYPFLTGMGCKSQREIGGGMPWDARTF
ncbi:phosphotransferase [Paenibacillus sp. NPDC057934]|uniref:phosphotransferase n=1 Tax=Paenibacillus sp. NPDC057934 TaxID=3346282 RepID=UPI0036DAF86E